MPGKRKKKIAVLAERLQQGLTEQERKFLLAAELGDVDVITNLLDSKTVSANKADTQGRTALDLAIISGQTEIVLYLIDKVSQKNLHNGLITAVENGRTEFCEIILKHPMYQAIKVSDTGSISNDDSGSLSSGNDEFTKLTVSTHDTIKPKNIHRKRIEKMMREALMKAAIKNNFQIVQMIMLRGVSLDFPHDYFCTCEVCMSEQQKDYMAFCNNRLDNFRALASPAYIILTEEDPIMATFRLSKRFQELRVIETEYQHTYLELDQQVQQFSLDLLDQCRSSEEVRSLLSDETGEDDCFPLLSTALNMEQKRFVAHSKCQAQVSASWFSGVQVLRRTNRFEFLILSIPIGIILLPVLSLVYIVAPWSKVALLLNNPSTRFLNYTCSFITFLCLIVIGKLNFSNMWLSLGCDETEPFVYVFITVLFMWIVDLFKNQSTQMRQSTMLIQIMNIMDTRVHMYRLSEELVDTMRTSVTQEEDQMSGWIWEEMKQLYEVGASHYFESIWNIIDSLMLTFLLASFTLDIVVPIRVSEAIRQYPISLNISGEILKMTMIPFCYSVTTGGQYFQHDSICTSSTVAIKADWSPSWVPDPELISDIFFSIGIVLSVARISFIMPANETFGTMLVSFRRTFGDVIKLCAMFALIILSFSCGLATLYAAHHCQTKYFNGMGNTMFVLLWSLLSFGPSDAPKLDQSLPMSSITNNPARDEITLYFGYIFYGIYVFAALVVLMNLLIAVMSNTFQEVQEERDVEWKFARTELWMTFIEPGCSVAPPFNIIPSPLSVCNGIRGLVDRLKYCCRRLKKNHKELPSHGSWKSADKKKHEIHKNRQETLCTLIRRYIVFAEREKSEGDEDATEDKLRRLIERVASKQDKRMDEIQNQILGVRNNVNQVHEGGIQIQDMQQNGIKLAQQLIEIQEMFRGNLERKWEEGNKFREDRLREVKEMRDHRRRLIEARRLSEAQKIEEEITDALDDADYVPRTTVQ